MVDPRSQQAVNLAEDWADGLIGDWKELGSAHYDALLASDEGPQYHPGLLRHADRLAAIALRGAVAATSPTATLDYWQFVHLIGDALPSAESDQHPADSIRDIFGNPFRPVTFPPEWRTTTAVALAQGMYESRDFGATPILADALQDAGCDSADVLDHCRAAAPHVRGCWVADLVLGKQ